MGYPVFGPGTLFVRPYGQSGATILNIGYAQSLQYAEKKKNETLFGQYRYPLAVATGTIDGEIKVKAAVISGLALQAVGRRGPFATGQILVAQDEAQVIDSTLYTVPANFATFQQDLGVVYTATGLPLLNTPAPDVWTQRPPVGSYFVGAQGTGGYCYIFNPAESGTQVSLNYAYTATGGQTQTVVNHLIGVTDELELTYASVYQGRTYYCKWFRCVSADLDISHGLTAFANPQMTFAVMETPDHRIYEVSYADIG